jgi:enoyl-CoA hydratase
MPHPHLMVEQDPAGFCWLRLARPQRRNALDVSLTAAIRDALAAEPSVPVLLGSADPAVFCAGADLRISDAEGALVSDLIYDCCNTIITRPGPVIAVLTGLAGPAAGRTSSEPVGLGAGNRAGPSAGSSLDAVG